MEIITIVIPIVIYVFYCYCTKLICENVGTEPGIIIWIPILQLIPLMRAAGLNPWLALVYLVPFINIVFLFYHWIKICTALDKSPWLVVLFVIPVLNIAVIPYLAFSSTPRT